jgi:hypothetical protein
MADILYKDGNYMGPFADTDSPGSAGTDLNTGDLRRKFNFGDRVSELAVSQDPFFRFVSSVAKVATDDPEFKFTERRGSWHKRYAYVQEWGTTVAGLAHTQATLSAGSIDVDDILYVKMVADYKSQGNITNVQGNASFEIGDGGTRPEFFLEDQIIKINTHGTDGTADPAVAFAAKDYFLGKIISVTPGTDDVVLGLKIVRTIDTAANMELCGWGADTTAESNPSEWTTAYLNTFTYEQLESAKCYCVGTVFDKGTGYPETWKDQPYSTGFGQCQIWKTSMVMDNTDRATVLKYEGNEWARIWKEKLVEHKWDIEQSLLFGSQNAAYRTTQGAVDWILQNGNIFTLAVATKSQDGFLDDLSNLLDPRYNNAAPTVFFCSTAVYNWLHKLSGYFANNVGIVQPNSGNTTPTAFPALTGSNAPLGRADMSAVGKKKVLGVDVTTISTVYGDINVSRNVHLDGTNIAMIGVNMKHCSYRPLVGNGINRDTSIYVGVQTLENSGVDRRVDQILTEAGMEFNMPEAHAVWKTS